jgi:DNA-binding protein H-NS
MSEYSQIAADQIKTLIDDLNTADLRALRAAVDVKLESRKKQDVDSAKAQIRAIADSMGCSVEEILNHATPEKSKKERAAVAMKYRNPHDHSQQWTGRGRTPGWVKQHTEVNAGKLEDLAIPAGDPVAA